MNKRRTHLPVRPYIAILFACSMEGESVHRNHFHLFNGAYRDHLRIHLPSCNGGIKKEGRTSAFLLFHFVFLLHVNLFAVGLIEDILEVGKFLVGDDLHAPSVFHLPLAFEGNDALIDVSGYERMYVKSEFLNTQMIDE